MAEQGKTPTRDDLDESDYDWLDVTDFTAGVYDYSSIAASSPNVPAPKGAADAGQTWACIALPAGGLGPLPGVAVEHIWTPTHNTGAGEENYITGWLVHDELADGTTECFVILEYDNGTNRLWEAFSFIAETGVFTPIVFESNPSSADGIFGSPYPQLTRVANTDPTTTPGLPVIVFPSGGPATASTPTDSESGQLWVYPDPTNPTAYGAQQLITSVGGGDFSSVSGQVIVHESRILVFAGITYDYPAGGGFETNEQINFTDPPNSNIFGFQQTVIEGEEPFGYGCAGSISAGELFLVKKRGGGVVVTGDLVDFNATYLPGVQPTGGLYGRGDSGVGGFAYCSWDNGLWIWNGSNTSQKASSQLDDNFFLPPEFLGGMDSNNYGFFCQWIGDKLYTSNNMVFDSRTNGWWRYYPTKAQGGMDLYYVNPVKGPSFYAGVLSFDDVSGTANPVFMLRFDEDTPTETFQWHSLPIRLTTKRYVQARSIIVRASSNDGNTGSQVKISIFNGTTQVGSVTTPSGDITSVPTMIRMPIGGVSAGSTPYSSEDITFRIEGIGNGAAAPNVHSVSIGWAKRTQAKTTGVGS